MFKKLSSAKIHLPAGRQGSRLRNPLLLVLFTFVFLIAGCGSADTTNPAADNETWTGVVESLGQSIYPAGTHKFEQAGKLVLLLESADKTKINLDQFLGQTVEVTGKIQAATGENPPLMKVAAIVLQKTTTPVSPAGYLDYRDPEFGFALHYPSALVASQARKGVYFSDAQGQKIIEVIVLDNSSGANLVSFLAQTYDYKSSQLTPVAVAGLAGYKFQNETGAVIYLGSGVRVFTLVWYDSDPANRETYRRYYLEVVQSFLVTVPNAPLSSAVESPDQGQPEVLAGTTTENKQLPAISATELMRGWYYGDADSKKTGTPVTWTLVDTGTRFAMWQRPAGAPTEGVVSLPQPTATASMLSVDKQTVLSSLRANIAKLAPEPSTGGGWALQQVAFADPAYVYATYNSTTETRRLLFTYALTAGNQVALTKQAYFRPGEERDWLVVEGTDAAFGKALTIVNAAGTITSEVRAGYREYQNSRYGYALQYPKNWYWQNASTSRVEFSETPFPAGLVRVAVEVTSGTKFTFNQLLTSGRTVIFYVPLTEAQSLKISGEQTYVDIVQAMAETFKKH